MTDREQVAQDRALLELAAKAAGINTKWQELSNPNGGTYTALCVGFGWGDEWNPLTDDGDALRLAVKLRLDVEVGYGQTIAGNLLISCLETHEADSYSATRIAIVRAAAEIGKGMV